MTLRIVALVGSLAALLVASSIQLAMAAGGPERPSFLPGYYAPLFASLQLTQSGEKDGLVRYAYGTADRARGVSVEGFACDRPRCQTVFNNAVGHFNTQMSNAGGRFRAASETEFRTEWRAGATELTAFVFKLPSGLQFWVHTARLGERLDADRHFTALEPLIDRQRYEEALAAGNVEMGLWAPAAHRHAKRLLAQGRKGDALAVLRNIVATAPFHFEAQLDLADHVGERGAARASAEAVFENAENPALLARAAKLLGRKEPTLAALPPVRRDASGLQVILIPLEPVDLRLVEAAGRIYQQITAVPVRLMRLDEPWRFGVPDRIPEQRAIQRAIIQQRGPKMDFTDWTRERYVSELKQSVDGKDALTRFQTQAFIDQLDERQAQYDGEPYLQRLLEMLAPDRGEDARTLYVGVTAANIYGGDTNFLFSVYTTANGKGASLLSYAMMTAQAVSDPYESRKRLAERLAKELVPASFKSLGIARPADPSDPYSYSDGVTRLDQKSLTLSAQTKAALDKFR